MYIYIYAYIYTYTIYIYIYMYTYTIYMYYIYIYICKHICVLMYDAYIYIYIHMFNSCFFCSFYCLFHSGYHPSCKPTHGVAPTMCKWWVFGWEVRELISFSETYPLVNIQKAIEVAIEIVDLPIKKRWFSIVMLVYQRVHPNLRPLKHACKTFFEMRNQSYRSKSPAVMARNTCYCSHWNNPIYGMYNPIGIIRYN